MVVLTVGLVTSGKTLIARQFVEMTRLRVEGLLGAFPKLIDSSRDHTFIETETVRYVYQPLETLHLVIVTNRSSNILEDLETLRLLAKVVQDCCQPHSVSEELILKHAFDIIFAFDEVVSFGHRESVTLAQIKTYTEMDSHEEKLHQMLEQSKMNEAREHAKKKQLELAKLRASAPKDGSGGGGMMPGIGSGSGGGGGGANPAAGSSMSMGDKLSSFQDSMKTETTVSAPWSSSMTSDDGPAMIKPSAPKKGMMLGKKKPGDIFGGMGGGAPAEATSAAEAVPETQAEAAAAAPAFNPLLEPVKVEIEERITANMQTEGGLVGEVECVGQFQVTVLDVSKGDLVCFKLNPQDNEFKYKVHPNLNKQSHANNILEVRDASKAFKANAPWPLIKWRVTSAKDSFLPISLSCWPSSTADGTAIVLEFELTDSSMTLEDVHVRFPAGPASKPQITSVDQGDCVYDAGNQEVHWHIPVIDANDSSGTLEFTATADIASLLPYTFEATRRGATKCPMEIVECYHQERKDAIGYDLVKSSTYALTVGA